MPTQTASHCEFLAESAHDLLKEGMSAYDAYRAAGLMYGEHDGYELHAAAESFAQTAA